MGQNNITIGCLHIGRLYSINKWLKALEDLDYPKNRINLVIHNVSKDLNFNIILKDWVNTNYQYYKNIKLIFCDESFNTLDQNLKEGIVHICEGYNHILQSLEGDYLLCFEDDCIPKADFLIKLLENFNRFPNSTVIAAKMVERPGSKRVKGLIAWDYSTFQENGKVLLKEPYKLKDVESTGQKKVGAVHQGFTLIKSEFLKNYKFRVDGVRGADIMLCHDVNHSQHDVILDYDVHVGHIDTDGEIY